MKKRGSTAKEEKGTLFYQFALAATRRKKFPFLSILLSLRKAAGQGKNTDKGIPFAKLTVIKQIAGLVAEMRKTMPDFVSSN